MPSDALAQNIVWEFQKSGRSLVLAESCTAGLVSDRIACVPGASQIFWGGYICYTIESKTVMLGLDPLLIEKCGAVSEETALAMAEGARRQSGASIAASVTGLAGPDGDDRGTPVGTVWIAISVSGGHLPSLFARCFHYEGSRAEIRAAAAQSTLELILEAAL